MLSQQLSALETELAELATTRSTLLRLGGGPDHQNAETVPAPPISRSSPSSAPPSSRYAPRTSAGLSAWAPRPTTPKACARSSNAWSPGACSPRTGPVCSPVPRGRPGRPMPPSHNELRNDIIPRTGHRGLPHLPAAVHPGPPPDLLHPRLPPSRLARPAPATTAHPRPQPTGPWPAGRELLPVPALRHPLPRPAVVSRLPHPLHPPRPRRSMPALRRASRDQRNHRAISIASSSNTK